MGLTATGRGRMESVLRISWGVWSLGKKEGCVTELPAAVVTGPWITGTP